MRLMLQGWTDRISEMLETVACIRAEAAQLSPFIAGLASNASAYGNMALGRYVDAEHDLAQARLACEPIHALYVLNYSASFAAAIELSLGNAASARTTLDGAMNRAIAEGQRYGSAGAVVAAYLAEVLYETNQLDACEALVNDYLSIVVETGLPDHLIALHRIAARLHLQQGRWDAAQAMVNELNELGARRGIRRLSAAAWLERTYVPLRRHDLDDARRSLTLGGDPSVWQAFAGFQPYASEIEDPLIAEARLRLVLGEGEQAVPRIQTALGDAEAAGRRRRALRLSFLQAQLLESVGRQGEADGLFDAAVERASLCGLVRTLADDNWVTESLVKRRPKIGDPRRAALLRELTPVPDAAVSEKQPSPSGEPSFHLTTREIQVLRLLWKGHSNKAIARDLFLSENTVETHLRRIYEKLGTRNRTQAAALAHEAGAI